MKLSELQQISNLFVSMSHEEAIAANRAFQEAAERFQATLNALLTPDNSGARPAFDNNALRRVLIDISAIRRSFPNAGVNGAVKDNFEQSISAVEHLFSCLNVKKGASLDVCIRDTEPISVKASQNLDQVGGAVSKRDMVVIEKATGRAEGFYTKSEAYMQVPQKETDIFREVREEVKDDPQAALFAEKVLNGKFGLYALNMSSMAGKRTDEMGAEDVCRIGYDPQLLETYGFMDDIPGNTAEEKFNVLLGNHNVARLLANAWLNMEPAVNEAKYQADHKLYGKGEESGIEIEVGSSRSGRNVAMSRVANLLGVGDRLAYSSNVSLQYENGSKVGGVFMEKAEGHDLPELGKIYDTEFMNVNEHSFDGEALKSVSELQIIDYICQNVDRHPQNMLYTFDDNHKLVKVEGIDHDYSFGTARPDDDAAKQFGTPLNDINVISESMKETVLALNPEALKSALSDTGLTDAEIAAAQERLRTLQTRLANSPVMRAGDRPVPGTIHTVPDNLWANMTVEDLTPAAHSDEKGPQGTFAMLKKAKSAVLMGKEYWEDAQKDPRKFEAAVKSNISNEDTKVKEFGQGDRVNELTTDRVNATLAELKEFNRELKWTQGLFHGSKAQFKDLRFAMDELEKLKLAPGQDLNEPEMFNVYEKMQNALNAVDAYIDYKEKDNDSSDTGTERLKIARRLKQKLDVQFQNFADAYHDHVESNLDQAYEEVQQTNTRFARFTDKLADVVLSHEEGTDKEAVVDEIRESGAFNRMLKAEGDVEKYLNLLETNPDKVYHDYKACAELEKRVRFLSGGDPLKAQIAENIYKYFYKETLSKSDAAEYQKEVREVFDDPVNKIRGIQQIMGGDVFKKMVDGKTEAQLQKMEVRALETYTTYLRETKAAEKKQTQPKKDLRDLLYPDIKEALFRQDSYANGRALMDPGQLKTALSQIRNPLDLSIDRSAFSSVAMSLMIADGKNIDEVMDPSRLTEEKKKYVGKALTLLDTGDGRTIATNYLKAQEKLVDYLNDHVVELKSLTLPEFMKDANKNLLGVFRLCKDISQECDRPNPVDQQPLKQKFFTPDERRAMDRLNDDFESVNLPIQMMGKAAQAIDHLYTGVGTKGELQNDLQEGLIQLSLQDKIFRELRKNAKTDDDLLKALETNKIRFINTSDDINQAMKNADLDLDISCLKTADRRIAVARSFMDGSANTKFTFRLKETETRRGKQMMLDGDALIKSVNSHLGKVAPERVRKSGL